MPRLLALAAATLTLSGCALESVAVSSEPGYPSEYDIENPFSGPPTAFWHDDRAQFDVVVIASSSCDLIPTKLDLVDENTLSLTFVKPRGSCDASLSSTTYTFDTPNGLGDEVELEVTIGDEVTHTTITTAINTTIG